MKTQNKNSTNVESCSWKNGVVMEVLRLGSDFSSQNGILRLETDFSSLKRFFGSKLILKAI